MCLQHCKPPIPSLPPDVKVRKLGGPALSSEWAELSDGNPELAFGWRKRIGLLSPTVIETAAYDFYRLAPDGVSMCATTSNIEQETFGAILPRYLAKQQRERRPRSFKELERHLLKRRPPAACARAHQH